MKTWMRCVFLMGCLLSAVGLAQQKPAEAPQAEEPMYEETPWPEKYDPRTLQPIRLFMTREEVLALWGEPKSYFYEDSDIKTRVITRRYFPPEEYQEAAKWISRRKVSRLNEMKSLGKVANAFRIRAMEVLKRRSPLDEVYYRETPHSRYEMIVEYMRDSADGSDSGPKRVAEVSFHPDTLRPVAETLDDLPETWSVCELGCEMFGTVRAFGIVMYPWQMTSQQREVAHQLARALEPLANPYREDWRPLLILGMNWSGRKEELDLGVHDVDWHSRTIRFVQMSLSENRFGVVSGSRSDPPKALHIGRFQVDVEGKRPSVEATQ